MLDFKIFLLGQQTEKTSDRIIADTWLELRATTTSKELVRIMFT